MAKIRKIEPVMPTLPTRKKVAAYARVSMETERLHHSLSAQVSYYSDLIQLNPEWEYAGVYADDGITGTKANSREEFQHMLEDCEAGKIDIILTKSISRFARNTVDLLETVRHLKELGVSVRFEKENIDSLSGDGEVMLTLLASFAQEEITSLSNNVKWGIRKRFEKGIPNFRNKILGYEWEDDHLVVVPEEAVIVKRIFQNFLDGKSRLETERELNGEGITTKAGCKWCDSNIKIVLSNITYTGNLLLQKEYIEDPITKKRRKNKGELPQYFVENNHEAIIDMETFQYVQDEMARRRKLGALANKSLKENIWTFDGKGELLLTIMSSLAQEESRSISENCTWGQRKRFADGKVSVAYKRFLGYDKGADGNLVINPEQAVTIRRIYQLFLQGMTYNSIAQELTKDGVLTPGGKTKWSISTVRSILSNEKYKGDALLQKSYTVDFLTKKTKINEGEIPQYYVEGNHEAIIDPDVFEMVQREIERRGKGKKYHSGVHAFSSKIKCGECGCWYGSKVWHSNSKYRKVIWRCNHKYDGDKTCRTPHLTNEEIQTAFLKAVNKLLETKEEVIANGYAMIPVLFDTTALEAEHDELLQETQVVSDMVQQCIYENAHVALDQAEYHKRYDALTQRFDKAKAHLEEVTEEISQKQT